METHLLTPQEKCQGHHVLIGGFTPSENMKVSWDDEIPNMWKNKIHVPNHQAALSGGFLKWVYPYIKLSKSSIDSCDFPL